MCMLVNPATYHVPSIGYSWPGSGSTVQDTVEATFGPRQFAQHANNYDFLVGTDIPAVLGQVGHAPIAGPISRLNWSYFGWQSAAQLAQWSITQGSLATFALSGLTTLLITGTRGGAKVFPTTSTNFTQSATKLDVSSGDWFVQEHFTTALSITGSVQGIGVYDTVQGEYVGLDYDGTTLTCRGKKASGVMAADGFTAAVAAANALWLMIYYTQSTNTLSWQYSTDQLNWTTFKTQTVATFTRAGFPAFDVLTYFTSLDTNAAAQTIQVDDFNWADNNTIARFGNFVQWTNANASTGVIEKWIICHLQEPTITLGAQCGAGQAFGIAGSTGYDTTSGPIDHIHFHMERVPNNNYFYSRSESINTLPVLPGVYPLASNVSVVRSSGNDPLGQASVIYTITVTRGNQQFYENTFQMVGTLLTGTINYNTRAGLNANVDLPNGNNMYQSPAVFDRTSASWVNVMYFNTGTYGTFVSGTLKDAAGATLTTVT